MLNWLDICTDWETERLWRVMMEPIADVVDPITMQPLIEPLPCPRMSPVTDIVPPIRADALTDIPDSTVRVWPVLSFPYTHAS